MKQITGRSVGSARILLLDLVWTFAVRPGGPRRGDYAETIRNTESYRLALLRQIQADGFFVIMLTARSSRYADVTLENISLRTGGWQPDVAIFNEDEAEPPAWKLTALHRYVFPAFGTERSRYFALEANLKTRRLCYRTEGIAVQGWEDYLSGQFHLPMNR